MKLIGIRVYWQEKRFESINRYSGLFKNEYGRRIIHGKINVYVQLAQVSSVANSGGYLDAYFYGQIGEGGPMTPLTGKKRIRKMPEACPLSVQLLDKGGRRKMNRDPNFLNHVFDVYNNDCDE